MLLYTVMPYESVFPQQCDMQVETRPVKGGFVELVKTGEARNVSRLISTDPRMYLRGPAPGDKF